MLAMIALFLSGTGTRMLLGATPGEAELYSCDFEQGAGIFRLVAEGDGVSAELDGGTAHGGRQCVKLMDDGADDADLAWGQEWANWSQKQNRASLQWARHWKPEDRFAVRKGCAYEVRAHVKLLDAHGVGIKLTVWSSEGLPVRGQPERYSPILTGTRDWCWVSARVACTSGDGELADVVIGLLGGGTAWVDDVRIVEYEEQDAPSTDYGLYPPARLEAVRIETASCIALEFIGDLQYFKAEKPENWLVQSEEDPAFGGGVRPIKVGRTRALDNPTGKLWWADTYRHNVFLLLPTPLRSGMRYRLTMANVGVEREEFELPFDERTNLNRNIKVNQYGYVPDALKYAYLGGWLGSAGPLPLDGYTGEFAVIDARTGDAVFRGTPVLRMAHDAEEPMSTSSLHNLTGEDVYQLDFSQVTAPGEYFILVPGVGRSYAFRVAGDVYAEPFYHCARAILHQRCGIELKEPYSRFARKPCHRSAGIEIAATIVEHGSEDEDQLVEENPALKTGTIVDAWGGYHDAADYDRLVGHYRVPACLLQLYEMFPGAFGDGQLDLPESGNGIPDIVDEALWQVDFGVRMQDAQDGGVRGGAGPNAVVTAPADLDEHPIHVYSKDPITSLSFAGVAAQAARVLGGLGEAGRAAPYLERAEKAWAYAVAHGGSEFAIPYAFAAVELYRTMGKREYHDAFLKAADAVVKLDPLAQARHQGLFVWNVWTSYVMCQREGTDEAVKEACRRRIVEAAEWELQNMETYAYRTPNLIDRPIRYGWGCGTNFPGGEFQVMAWRLTGQKRYRDHALLAADFSLGCHPTGEVFITGLGQRSINWPMHSMSDPMATQIGAPVEHRLPGIPIFGVHAYPLGFSGWQSQLLYVYANPSTGADNYYPPARDWPDLRLFADIGWVPILSEHTVASTMLHTTYLYGALLSAGSFGQGDR